MSIKHPMEDGTFKIALASRRLGCVTAVCFISVRNSYHFPTQSYREADDITLSINHKDSLQLCSAACAHCKCAPDLVSLPSQPKKEEWGQQRVLEQRNCPNTTIHHSKHGNLIRFCHSFLFAVISFPSCRVHITAQTLYRVF